MNELIPLFKVAMAEDAGHRVAETLASGYVGQGPKVDEFERAFADAVGLDRLPLGVNSCTSAIDLALHCCGVGPGDLVFSTPMTCTATNGAIVNRGSRIAWLDIDSITGLVHRGDIASKIREYGLPRAIVAVDWGGRLCNYDLMRHEAPGIPIIEDAAHRLYASPFNGVMGDYVCWSFGPIKHLTCGGYGGALLTPPDQTERARLLRWHGLDRLSKADFRCEQMIHEAGYRYHMTDDMATVGLANLPLAIENVQKARENAAWYSFAFRGVPGIRLQPYDETCDYWLYTLLADDRNGLIAALGEQQIQASPVHSRNDIHPAYHFPNGPLPGVDYFAAHEVAIPVGWWVTPSDRERIARAVMAHVAGWEHIAFAEDGHRKVPESAIA